MKKFTRRPARQVSDLRLARELMVKIKNSDVLTSEEVKRSKAILTESLLFDNEMYHARKKGGDKEVCVVIVDNYKKVFGELPEEGCSFSSLI